MGRLIIEAGVPESAAAESGGAAERPERDWPSGPRGEIKRFRLSRVLTNPRRTITPIQRTFEELWRPKLHRDLVKTTKKSLEYHQNRGIKAMSEIDIIPTTQNDTENNSSQL